MDSACGPSPSDSFGSSDSKAVSDSYLLSELQLCKSHGLLDTSTQVSLSPLYPCLQLSLATLPNLPLPWVPIPRTAVLPTLQVSTCVLPSPESPDAPRVLGPPRTYPLGLPRVSPTHPFPLPSKAMNWPPSPGSPFHLPSVAPNLHSKHF